MSAKTIEARAGRIRRMLHLEEEQDRGIAKELRAAKAELGTACISRDASRFRTGSRLLRIP